MNIKTCCMALCVGMVLFGCSKKSHDFEMTVDRVDKLQGFILRGISISGTVKSGCLANGDMFIASRGDEKVLDIETRILETSRPTSGEQGFNGKIYKGETVSLYIPDGNLGDVVVGDVLSGENTQCNPAGDYPVKIELDD